MFLYSIVLVWNAIIWNDSSLWVHLTRHTVIVSKLNTWRVSHYTFTILISLHLLVHKPSYSLILSNRPKSLTLTFRLSAILPKPIFSNSKWKLVLNTRPSSLMKSQTTESSHQFPHTRGHSSLQVLISASVECLLKWNLIKPPIVRYLHCRDAIFGIPPCTITIDLCHFYSYSLA